MPGRQRTRIDSDDLDEPRFRVFEMRFKPVYNRAVELGANRITYVGYRAEVDAIVREKYLYLTRHKNP